MLSTFHQLFVDDFDGEKLSRLNLKIYLVDNLNIKNFFHKIFFNMLNYDSVNKGNESYIHAELL